MYDLRIYKMNKILHFKKTYERFIEALDYINKNTSKLKADPDKWVKIKKNFFERFQKPLDEAWDAMTDQERKTFLSLYIHRRDISDKLWQTILRAKKVFNGKIKTKIIEEV